MEIIDPATFDRSTLRERLDPPQTHFARLLSLGVAQRTAWVRELLAAERELVSEVWQDGDELWRWSTAPPYWGACGLVVLRADEVVRQLLDIIHLGIQETFEKGMFLGFLLRRRPWPALTHVLQQAAVHPSKELMQKFKGVHEK